MSDNEAMAKVRIDKALDALGNGRDGESFSQSCVWKVVGLGSTLEGWTALIRAGGGAMNSDKASAIFHGALERLGIQYAGVTPGSAGLYQLNLVLPTFLIPATTPSS